MRLFGKVDGTIDRFERASWLTMPFDLELGTVAGDNGPYTIEQQRLFTPGTIEANIWPVGTDRQLVFTPGSFQINIVRP